MTQTTTQQKLMTNWRWWLCSLLFVATTVNYLDRQVLSLTYEEFIKPEFHWTDANYGTITSFYAIACLFAGKFVDWMGTKKGYLIAIGVWSLGACMHAGCGIATVLFTDGIESTAALKGIEAGSNIALAVSTTSVYLFLLCRGILALGESGNFPAAIKVTAEYFPKKGLRHLHIQCRSIGRRSGRSSSHPAACSQIRLGDVLHHHRSPRICLDVLLDFHVRQAGKQQACQPGRA